MYCSPGTLTWLILSLPLFTAYPTVLWNISAIDNITVISTKIDTESKIDKIVIINASFSKHFCLSNYDLKIITSNNAVMLLNVDDQCPRGVAKGETLIICCLPKVFKPEFLKNMVFCLGARRNSRIVFIWNTEHTSSRAKERVALHKQQQLLFEYCARKHLLNVISIYRDFLSDGHFYTFSYFPEFHLERKTLNEPCFPNRIKDLKGSAIKALPKYNEPWALVWRNSTGQLQIGGYFSKIVQEFVRRHNGTLTWPIPFDTDTRLPIPLWIELLKNDTIDVVIGLAPIESTSSGFDVSTVVLLADWTIMLPLPSVIPDSELLLLIINSILGLVLLVLLLVFTLLFTVESVLLRRRLQRYDIKFVAFFLSVFFNLVIRSMIGQSSYMSIHTKGKSLRSFIYVLLFLSGIFMSILISATLNSYLTSPLRYSRVNTFEELTNSDVLVKSTKYEHETLPGYIGIENFRKLNQTFKYPPENRQLATTMDTRYGYTILTPLWSIIARYQTFLPTPLFYVSEHIYLTRNLPMCIPIREHSIYKEELDQMILLIHSTGLTNLWTQQSYDDMIMAGKINTTTHLGADRPNIMGLKNFYYLWWMYGIGVSLSVIVFFAEILYNKKQGSK